MAWSDAARRAAVLARKRRAMIKPKNRARLALVNKVEGRIKRSAHYEDRLEYTAEDLSSTYDLDKAQGRLLYRRLQSGLRKGYAEAEARMNGLKPSTMESLIRARSRKYRPNIDRKKVASYLRSSRRR